jgi:PEP-CTERM motif
VRQTVQRHFLGLSVALALFSLHSARADITWGTPQTISGDTDIQTNGTVFAAYAVGSAGVPSTTVNGVLFSSFVAPATSSSVTVGNVTLSTTSGVTVNGHTNIFGVGGAPFANLSAAYQTLISSGANPTANSPAPPMTVTIAGLTLGASYQVEYWVNDSRSGSSVKTEMITGGPTLSFNNGSSGNDEGGVGQFVIGKFTAGSASESFTITGTGMTEASQINALEVLQTSSVPEPSSWMLAGIGLSLACLVARRQRLAAA